jgi:NADH:ubiquinone oxidoreductase subunit H
MNMFFYIKMALIYFLFIWVCGTIPCFRCDKFTCLACKSFLPLSLNYLLFKDKEGTFSN